MADTTKIIRCKLGRCRTCPYMKECSSFSSNVTNLKYLPILKSCESLSCQTENVIYLISCKICNFQYIGETQNSIQKRFSGHRSSINSKNSSQLVHQHFDQECHGLSNCEIIPIEKIESNEILRQELTPEQTKRALTRFRLDREKYWISTLQSAYPYGLNVRIKGIGDFNPSQARYHDFGGRRRRKRPHSKRKPKRLRPKHEATVNFVVKKHQDIQNSIHYIHYFKQYLYGLPRKHLHNLWNEIKLPNDLTDARVKDMINMIAQLRLFKPASTAIEKRRAYYHLEFIDKGLDFINPTGILRSPSVTSRIPNYFTEQDPPIIGYIYNASIAGQIFNYKQSLSSEIINSTNTNNFQCECYNSTFKDPHHNHIISGSLDIVQNLALKKILSKGPKYRLPRKIDWMKNRENLIDFIEIYSLKWIEKEKKEYNDGTLDIQCLKSWKEEVLRLIDKRIASGKTKLRNVKSLYIRNDMKTELDRLKELYVITPTDKAQNNICFTCKPFYIKILKGELTTPGLNTYQLTNLPFETVIEKTCHFSEDMGVKVSEEMKDIPIIYWIPKMHKNPTSQRFIAGSKQCTIKTLSKLFSKSLKLILNHLENYNRTVFGRANIKYFWIINNSLDFLDNIKNLKTNNLETYDFSTLYTSLPHREIRNKFKSIFGKIFYREGKQFINVNRNKAYFSNSKLKNFHSYTEKDLIKILDFILDNIYVKFGDEIYKQIIGIPIGLDSGQDIANLLLQQYEATYVENLSKRDLVLARKFNNVFRYIDDLFNCDFPEFKQHLPLIYPPELIVNASSDMPNSVNYLDLAISSDLHQNLIFSIYDKREDFNFEIVNFPFLDSCIPRKPALGIFLSQLIRYARICSKFEDFCKRSINLSKKLQSQGYKFHELRKLIVRFYQERAGLLTKYQHKDINTFINETLFKR